MVQSEQIVFSRGKNNGTIITGLMKAEEIKQIQNETRIKQRGKLIYIHSLNPAISMVAISEDKFKPQNHPSYSPDLVHCKFIYIVS